MTYGYAIEYRKAAAKYLLRLPVPERERVVDAIEALAENPDSRQLDAKRLRNRPGYRLRVGGVRVIYERYDDRLVIRIVAIGPRGDVYKG